MRGKNADAGDPPTFSEAEDIVLANNGTPADAETLTTLRRQTRARLGRIARLEQACASTITLLHSSMVHAKHTILRSPSQHTISFPCIDEARIGVTTGTVWIMPGFSRSTHHKDYVGAV